MQSHPELARDFAKHFPTFDPYEVLIEQTPALVRRFYARLGRLYLEHDSEYYAPERKERARIAKEEKDALKASPDFDADLYEFEMFEAAEEARKANPLEFRGYSSTDERIDELNDEMRRLRHTIRQHWAGERQDELPPFRPVHRPGMEIKHPEMDDPRFASEEELEAQFGTPE